MTNKFEELVLSIPVLDSDTQKKHKGGWQDTDDFWNDWGNGYQLDEFIGYADGSSSSNSDFWNDYYWTQQNYGHDDYGDQNGAWGDYGDYYGDDYTNDGGASAWGFEYEGLDISATGLSESKMQEALGALGLSTGIQSLNHSTLSQLARLLGAERSTVELLSKSGTKIGVIGAVIGGIDVSITLSDANWDASKLSGEEKEDIAIAVVGMAGAAASAAVLGGVAAANFWNPVGWALGGVAVGWAIWDYTQDNNNNTNDVFNDGDRYFTRDRGSDGRGNQY